MKSLLPLLLLPMLAFQLFSEQLAEYRVLLKFKDGTSEESIQKVEKTFSLKLKKEFKFIPTRLYLAKTELSIEEFLKELNEVESIDYAERDVKRYPNVITPTSDGSFSSSEPQFGQQWYLHNTGQEVNGGVGPVNVDLDWPEAIQTFPQTNVVMVAVIDTGINYNHKDIRNNIAFNVAETPDNGIDDDGNGYIDDYIGWDTIWETGNPFDLHGHGTLVSSIIAGLNYNQLGIEGVAPLARIVPIRALDHVGQGHLDSGAHISDAVQGIEYAIVRGVDIINMSLGGNFYSDTEFLIIEEAFKRGILIVAAAGNGGSDGLSDDNDREPMYPASYGLGNIISVASVDRNAQLSTFSNYGEFLVDVAAFGEDVVGGDVQRETVFFEEFHKPEVTWTAGTFASSATGDGWNYYSYTKPDGTRNQLMTLSTFPHKYTNGTFSYVLSDPIQLPATPHPQLRYKVFYDLSLEGLYRNELPSFSFIDISENSEDWVPLGVVLANIPGFEQRDISGGEIPLQERTADLTGYEGKSVKFRLSFYAGNYGQGFGVAYDDIKITTSVSEQYLENPNQTSSGTSFSAPIVSGIAALIRGYRRDIGNDEIKKLIVDSCVPDASLTGKVRSGGWVHAYRALHWAHNFVRQPFSGTLFNIPRNLRGKTANITLWDDSGNQYVYNGAKFTSGIKGHWDYKYLVWIFWFTNTLNFEYSYETTTPNHAEMILRWDRDDSIGKYTLTFTSANSGTVEGFTSNAGHVYGNFSIR